MRLAILLFILVSLASAEKLNISVNELSGQNIDKATMGILSERTRAELIQTGAFTVLERTERDAILDEMGFQLSGACDESSCLVEIGRMLGVQQMIAGSVGKLNDQFYSVSLRIIDVESGAITVASNHDFRGNLENLLSSGIREAVLKLVEEADITIQDARYQGLFAELYIGSSIEGATITIDGQEHTDLTPTMVDQFPAGNHTITVSKDSYVGRMEITVEPNDFRRIQIPMEQLQTSIVVHSEPIGASVYLDQNYSGTTPLQLDELTSGVHQLELKLSGFSSQSEEISLGRVENERFSFTLTSASYLSVITSPRGASVLIDGEEIGTTPYFNDEFPAGEYQLMIQKENLNPLSMEIGLRAGDTLEINETLASSFGMVKITSNDEATILIDNSQPQMTSWFSQKVVPGQHEFSITLEDHVPYTGQFILDQGGMFNEHFELNLTPEAAIHQRTVRRRIILGTIAALAVGAGVGISVKNAQP